MLWLLVVVTALNTAVIAGLAVSTIRSRSAAPMTVGAAPSRVVETTPRPAAADPGPVGDDPLAGAISAFLSRPDGLFRSGGPPIGAGSPGPTAVRAASTAPPTGAATPPVRYVASAPRATVHRAPEPRPTGTSPTTTPAGTPSPVDATPMSAVVRPGPIRAPVAAAVPVAAPGTTAAPDPTAAPAAGPVGPPADAPVLPASRVSIWFVGRDPSRSTVEPAAVGRLGPVIAGLLHERTRAEDRVAVEGGRRFVVTLPDTSIDGAAALTRRLARSCDAWLAAEEPPLRLEFGMTELPGAPGRPAGPLDPTTGPERRRPVHVDA